ncbi:MAG: hypothetical protein LIP05_11865 [Tannerellaceae bacterium]|nr:hypothetical protein [Tannerellaceae bacterium]
MQNVGRSIQTDQFLNSIQITIDCIGGSNGIIFRFPEYFGRNTVCGNRIQYIITG